MIKINSDVETVFLLTGPKTSFISNSIIRDIFRNGGDISKLVPAEIMHVIISEQKKE